MLVLITGGSGSGKSAMAEKIAYRLANSRYDLYYAATMIAGSDNESKNRIKRHQNQRSTLGFTTIEQPFDFQLLIDAKTAERLPDDNKPVILLECLSNLLANEMFLRTDFGLDHLSSDQAAEIIDYALVSAEKNCEHLIVVSNEIFADAIEFDQDTEAYLRLLGWLNQQLASRADLAVEMVYGLPLIHKGSISILEDS